VAWRGVQAGAVGTIFLNREPQVHLLLPYAAAAPVGPKGVAQRQQTSERASKQTNKRTNKQTAKRCSRVRVGRAVPVPCRAVPCRAVPCRAVPSGLLRAVQGPRGVVIRLLGTWSRTRSASRRSTCRKTRRRSCSTRWLRRTARSRSRCPPSGTARATSIPQSAALLAALGARPRALLAAPPPSLPSPFIRGSIDPPPADSRMPLAPEAARLG
jgi:hypothetical protein